MNSISTSTLTKTEQYIPVKQQSQGINEFVSNDSINTEKEQKVSKKDLEKAIEKMNELLEPTYTDVQFKLHEKTHSYYAVLVDSKTSEVIKEIPSKKMLDIYAAMQDFLGILFDKKI